MRKLFALLLFLCLCAPFARAQTGVPYSGEVRSTTGPIVPGASIYVCAGTVSLTSPIPCSPQTNIYSDPNLTILISQPLHADGNGNFTFYATPGTYVISVTGIGIIPVSRVFGIGGGGGNNAWSSVLGGSTNTGQGFVITPALTQTSPLFTFNCFANGGSGACVNYNLTTTSDSVTNMQFFGTASGPFGPQVNVPITMNIPTIQGLDTVRVFALTNGGPGTTCNWGERMDGDGFFVMDGTCSLAITNPTTKVFGELQITNNQLPAAPDLLIDSFCSPGGFCGKTGGVPVVDMLDAVNGTEFFKAPDNESITNPPQFPLSIQSAQWVSGVQSNVCATPGGILTIAGCTGGGGGGSAFAGGLGNSYQDVGTISTPGNPVSGAIRLFNNANVFGAITSTGTFAGAEFGSLVLTTQNSLTLGDGTANRGFVRVKSGGSNTTPGYLEADSFADGGISTFLFPCGSSGLICASATAPAADSNAPLAQQFLQTSAATNFGTALSAQTVIASAPATGLVMFNLVAVQSLSGVGCSAASNSVTPTVSYTNPAGGALLTTFPAITITGNGSTTTGPGAGGTASANQVVLTVQAGSAVTYTTTSSLGSSGCSTVPQYTVYAKAQ